MMYGADLYRRLARRDGRRPVVARGRVAPAGVVEGAARGAPAPGGLGEDVRAAARADLRRRGPRPLPADVDRRRARRGLAADRRLARSVRARAGARRRARAKRGATIRTAHARRRRSASSAGGSPASRSRHATASARRSRPTSSSTPAGCSRRRSAGWPGVTIPIIPMAHQYLFTEAIEGVDPDAAAAARPGQPRATSARRSAGCAWAATSATRRPGRSTASRPTSTASSSTPDWPRFEEIMAGAIRRVPAIADAGVTPDDQRPRGRSRPTTSSSSARARSAGSSSPPGSAPTGSPARAASAARWRRWIVDGEPELDLWKMDIRRFGGQYRSRSALRSPGRPRTTRPTTTSTTRTRSAWPAGRCASRRRTRGSPALGRRRSARSRGWERPNWFDAERRRAGGRGARGAPAARLGGRALVARRSARRRSRRAGPRACSTRRASPRSRSTGRARCAFLQRLCANDVDVAGRVDRLHPDAQPPRRHRVRLHGHARSRADRFLIVTGTAFGNHDLGWIRKHLPERRLASEVRDVTSARACFGLWGPRARDILAPLTTRRPLERGLPVPDRARDHASATCRSSRCG